MSDNGGQRVFTTDELRAFDGHNGAAEYIAVNGLVYDITEVQLLRGGKHHGVTAGKDVSDIFVHNKNILNRLRTVGTLEQP